MLHNQNPIDFQLQVRRAVRLPLPPAFRQLPRHRIPLPARLVGILFGLAFSTRAITILFSDPVTTDSFSPYETIMPGQIAAALVPYHCRIIADSPHANLSQTECSISPEQSEFQSIHINLQEDRIQSLIYFSESLRLGSLVLNWGIPTVVRRDGRPVAFEWHLDGYTVRTPVVDRYQETLVRVVIIAQKATFMH
jgi:hypothetical protein